MRVKRRIVLNAGDEWPEPYDQSVWRNHQEIHRGERSGSGAAPSRSLSRRQIP